MPESKKRMVTSLNLTKALEKSVAFIDLRIRMRDWRRKEADKVMRLNGIDHNQEIDLN